MIVTSRRARRALSLLALPLAFGCTASGAQEPGRARPKPAAPSAPAAPKPMAAEPAPVAPAPVTVANPRVAEALNYDPDDPLGNLESADALDRMAHPKRRDVAAIPKRGCAITEDARPVWPEAGIASLAADGGEYVVAGYTSRAQDERLFVVRITADGKFEPLATEVVRERHGPKRVAAPGVAVDAGQGITVAFTDGRGNLLAQRLRGASRGASATLELAQGVDTRFTPAVAYGKRGALVAYTLGTTPMRSMLLRLDADGRKLATHDVTPAAMGAAAPAFVAGASPPVLITADARSGMSPISRVALDSEGKPGASEVAVPVGMMSQPPELAAAMSGGGLFVGYAGLGAAATSAIGLVRLTPKVGAPEAMVKGTAYGELHLDAAASKRAVFFAMDAPTTAGKSPQHEIRVVRVDAQGAGPALRIAAASGDATHASIAYGQGGSVGVVFSAQDGVYFVKLACEPD